MIILLCRTLYTTLSIVAILVVIFSMSRYHKRVAAASGGDSQQLDKFLKQQRYVTKTMILSCCVTFFLFVVPTTGQIFVVLFSRFTSTGVANSFIVMLSLINSLNTLVLLLYRQRDLLLGVQSLLCRKSVKVSATTTILS
ncbi:unnamed protein product [Gongylonema pulchrum]|uniref:G_PROTEIN_RECEP_F1_2 domain-containing protein n=1 Tax=Gongylonema pulchrum TaxID=637853 RepID=A0A183EIB6_9BILA|nr:unnamed protein product [Gongylonema pulchrum]